MPPFTQSDWNQLLHLKLDKEFTNSHPGAFYCDCVEHNEPQETWPPGYGGNYKIMQHKDWNLKYSKEEFIDAWGKAVEELKASGDLVEN